MPGLPSFSFLYKHPVQDQAGNGALRKPSPHF
jgi:hypothetical protein